MPVLLRLFLACAAAAPLPLRVAEFDAAMTGTGAPLEEAAKRLAGADLDAVLLRGLDRVRRRKLLAGLRAGGLGHQAAFPGGGGLAVAARWPLRGARFAAFRHRGDASWPWSPQARRPAGRLIVDLETPRGPVALINARLETAYAGPEHDSVKLAQIAELAADLPDDRPLVLGGDLRLARTDRELGLLIAWRSLRLLPGAEREHLLIADGGGRRLTAAGVNPLWSGQVRLPDGGLRRIAATPPLAADLRLSRGEGGVPAGEVRRRLAVWAAARLSRAGAEARAAMRPLLVEGFLWLMIAAWLARVSRDMRRRRLPALGSLVAGALSAAAFYRGLVWLPAAADAYERAVITLMRG